MKALIVLEFNELCEPLINQWIDEGELPNFQRIRSQAQLYKTVADAAPPALEPWIQWYSMHTGLSYAEHHVFNLTEGQKQIHSDIWSELQHQGLTTFNCGSMNAKANCSNGSIYIPDPWCTETKPYPESIRPYFDFVSEQVQNQSARNSLLSKFNITSKFLFYMIKHGLSLQTVTKVCSQLALEKVSSHDLYWKRAFILDWLQLDLFESLYKDYHPDFSTFFLNSTAHIQHSFWCFMEPDKFDISIKSKEYKEHKDAVLMAYRNMDTLIGRFFDLIGSDATLALATGLSQQAFVKNGDYQVYYRLKDVDSFVQSLGFKDFNISPIMTHQYIFKAYNKKDNSDFCSMLDHLVLMDGTKIFDYNITPSGAVCFGTYLTRVVKDEEKMVINEMQFNFTELLHRIQEVKSGCHNPNGTFWIMNDKVPKRCSTLAITDVNGIIKRHFNVAN